MADSLFTELKRRNVFKVGIAYLVLAWLVVQITSEAVPALHLPEWINSAVFFFGLIGFPFALFFAWAFEITPEGIKKESDIAPEESITTHTGRKLDYIIIGLLVIVAGYFIYESRFESQSEDIVETTETILENKPEPQSEASDKSIAVLAFVNMSSDEDQEYFADGISEEILNALVKATGLRVAGRTSSFSFKGKDATIKHIGELLNVTYVLEGSVRKQKQNVRITAQLIKAADDFHLWSETYNGNLDNIFDLQEDIARKVTEQLKLLLNLGDKQRLASIMTSNVDAYDLFLRGREKVRQRLNNNIPEGIALLQKAVELDENFAEAWAKLAEAEAVSHGYVRSIDVNLANTRALSHIKRALEVNSNLALPHAVKGLISLDQAKYLPAIEYYTKALNLEPNNLLAIRWLGNTYAILGLEHKAFPLFEKAYALDPLSAIDTWNLGSLHFKFGNLEQAIRFFKLSGEIRGSLIDLIAFIYNSQGHTQKSLDFYLELYKITANRNGTQNFISEEQAKTYGLGIFNGSEKQKQAARKIGGIRSTLRDIQFPWQLKYYLVLDDIDLVYKALNTKPYLFANFAADDMWLPLRAMKKFRTDPRFIKLLEKYNLPIAWQKIGWPKYCQPIPATDGSNGQFKCQ